MTGRSAYPEVVNVPKRVGSGLPRVWLDVSIGAAKSAPLTLTLTLTLILTLALALTLPFTLTLTLIRWGEERTAGARALCRPRAAHRGELPLPLHGRDIGRYREI